MKKVDKDCLECGRLMRNVCYIKKFCDDCARVKKNAYRRRYYATRDGKAKIKKAQAKWMKEHWVEWYNKWYRVRGRRRE